MSSTCPICDKDFPLEEIIAHADECLFQTNKSNKRAQETNEPNTSCHPFFVKRPRKSFTNDDSTSSTTVTHQNTNVLQERVSGEEKPLADKMRPTCFGEYVGQEHVLGENTVLRNLLEKNSIPSMILWGPPGCGKTTLAFIIQKLCQTTKEARFVKMSATLVGVNDVKELVTVAKNDLKMLKRKTVLFMDEIHRFNKLQQDIFLPNVESGVITLIGATTENPSFSLNSALLSRCRVFVLHKLKSNCIGKILRRAADSLNIFIGDETDEFELSKYRCKITHETIKWLSDICDGDARIALNSFQLALESTKQGQTEITLEDIKDGIKRSHMLYDRKGDEHYNLISALHKSIRASDEDAALYWLARMLEGGEDPLFIGRRLIRAASEDIGLADPKGEALNLAVTALQGCKAIGMPECGILLAQVAVYLARNLKSREIDTAWNNATHCVRNHKGPQPSVPLHLRNTKRFLEPEEGESEEYNLPPGLENVDFFNRY